MSWRGSYMTHEDGFGYGTEMGLAMAIRTARKLAESGGPEARTVLHKLESLLATPDVREALEYLEKKR